MESQDVNHQIKEGYKQINKRWITMHFNLLFFCAVLSLVLEILMFWIISNNGILDCSVEQYWVKYIYIPFGLNAIILFAGYFILHSKKLADFTKQYGISILFVFLAFVLQLMHSGFVAVLFVAVFPILMTIMYENQKLTLSIAVLSIVTQVISAYSVFWDPRKVIDGPYTINLIILLTASFCAWLSSAYMISFMKMKRELNFNNDLERFRLKKEIDIDGLTRVGNKTALGKYYNSAKRGFMEVSYLAMIDLDDFKNINDTYGHVFGDEVLRCLGDALLSMRAGTKSFRYGGDEFCSFFEKESLEEVIQELKGVQKYLDNHAVFTDKSKKAQISIGVVAFNSSSSISDLLKLADKALYESKINNRSGITVYEEKSNKFQQENKLKR